MSEKLKKNLETTLAIIIGTAALAGTGYAAMKGVEAHHGMQPSPTERDNPQHVGAPASHELVKKPGGEADITFANGKTVTIPGFAERSH